MKQVFSIIILILFVACETEKDWEFQGSSRPSYSVSLELNRDRFLFPSQGVSTIRDPQNGWYRIVAKSDNANMKFSFKADTLATGQLLLSPESVVLEFKQHSLYTYNLQHISVLDLRVDEKGNVSGVFIDNLIQAGQNVYVPVYISFGDLRFAK